MITGSVTLDAKDFFHARPAAKIAGTAKTYESVIMVMLGTEIADAKDPLSAGIRRRRSRRRDG